MSLQESLNVLHEQIKEFQKVVKERIFNLGKVKVSVIQDKNEEGPMPVSLGLYFLSNSTKELLSSNKKLKDFNRLHKNIKRLFQKFIDTNELSNFDKGEDLFKKLNENDCISPFKPLFCDIFHENINGEAFKNKCNELKHNISNFNNFRENYRELYSKIQYFETLRAKFEEFQNALNSGNLKKLNEENLEEYRLFRSFYPLNDYSDYLIDIKNGNVIKINK
jgi:Fe-S-cluster containining protein